MGEIISVVSQKGGVGKTTTAVNLGASLASLGYRTLLIDLDPQGHVAASFKYEKYDIKSGIYELIENSAEDAAVIYPTPTKDFDFIPSNIFAEDEERLSKINAKKRLFLREPLKRLMKKYDYIFIDCPPSLGKLTFNALVSAHSLIIPIQCEFYALKSLSRLFSMVRKVKRNYNSNLSYRGFLLTMVDLRSNLSRLVLERLRYRLNGLIFNTMIPRNIRLAEVPYYGKPVNLIDKTCKGADSYLKLAQELLNQDGTIESTFTKMSYKKAENY